MAALNREALFKVPFSNNQRPLTDRQPHALLRRSLHLLTPSFLRANTPSDPNIPTAFLNGIRGFAALFVFISHFTSPTHINLHYGYGGNNGQHDHNPLQLPIIRVIHSGLACVHVFFVISGFSISLKAIKLMRKGSYDDVLTTLVSATFRRTLRLFIPCFVLLGCVFILVLFGAFDYANELVKEWPFSDTPEMVPPVKPTVLSQTANLIGCVVEWADILNKYSRVQYMPYAPQLWTIPVELKCSLITFVCLLGLTKSRPSIRIATLTALTVYFYLRQHPDPALFLGGTIFAELYVIRQERAAAIAGSSSATSITAVEEERAGKRTHKIKYGLLFAFAIFLLSYPVRNGGQAYFYRSFYILSTLIVDDKGKHVLDFITCVGSLILVFAVSQSPWIHRLFNTPLARYLGNISFGLYCVHEPLIDWFGFRNMIALGKVFGFERGWALAFIWQIIVTVWLADLFWRVVDEPSVSFARWVERICERPNDSEAFPR